MYLPWLTMVQAGGCKAYFNINMSTLTWRPVEDNPANASRYSGLTSNQQTTPSTIYNTLSPVAF